MVLRTRCPRKGERHGTQIQIEEPDSESGLVVVIPLWGRAGDDVDLPIVETESLLDPAELRLWRLR